MRNDLRKYRTTACADNPENPGIRQTVDSLPSVARSLVPGLHPAFHHLQYGKAGEGMKYIYHVSNIEGTMKVERTYLCTGELIMCPQYRTATIK